MRARSTSGDSLEPPSLDAATLTSLTRCCPPTPSIARWVELLEIDGIAPYTYSEELPYDDLLAQHSPGVQQRTAENPVIVVAALPRADSPSAERYVREREGETAWTMHLTDELGVEKVDLPEQLAAQIERREHVALQAGMTTNEREAAAEAASRRASLDPNARAWDQELPANFRAPDLDGVDASSRGRDDSEPPPNYVPPSLDE